jgi:hypothetical protein
MEDSTPEGEAKSRKASPPSGGGGSTALAVLATAGIGPMRGHLSAAGTALATAATASATAMTTGVGSVGDKQTDGESNDAENGKNETFHEIHLSKKGPPNEGGPGFTRVRNERSYYMPATEIWRVGIAVVLLCRKRTTNTRSVPTFRMSRKIPIRLIQKFHLYAF